MKCRTIALAAAGFLACIPYLTSEVHADWKKTKVGTIGCAVFVPASYTETTKLPLVINLHGVGPLLKYCIIT